SGTESAADPILHEDPVSLAEAGAALGDTVTELTELVEQAQRVQEGLLNLKFTRRGEEDAQ
ncbi:MAG: hypothetical protein QGF59_07445, partial [Pirellulaceae bacterium]|nr:hypothetical protein [Pirellulaceae bacterium]